MPSAARRVLPVKARPYHQNKGQPSLARPGRVRDPSLHDLSHNNLSTALWRYAKVWCNWRLTKSFCANSPAIQIPRRIRSRHGPRFLLSDPVFPGQFVAMVKTFERSLLLHVGKMVVPLKLGDRAVHWARNGRKGTKRNEVTISEPAPAKGGRSVMVARSSATPGGGTSFSRTSSVPVCGGMIRGRFRDWRKKERPAQSGPAPIARTAPDGP